jgi:hypothetical protein
MNRSDDPRPEGLPETQTHSAAYVITGLTQGFMLTLSLFLLISLGL